MNDPKTYLSVSEGKYRIIQNAIPIHADKTTLSEALDVAKQYKLALGSTYWNGDAGEWRPSSELGALGVQVAEAT